MSITANESSFPVLVRLVDGANGFTFTDLDGSVTRDGRDIKAQSTDGSTDYPCEVERCATPNVEVWVLVPIVYASGNNDGTHGNGQTTFNLFWGKTGQSLQAGSTVFNGTNLFVGNWHLKEPGSITAGAYQDAVGTANLTGIGMVQTDSGAGVVAVAQNFGNQGTAKYLYNNTGPSYTSSSFTVMAWAKMTGAAGEMYFFSQGGTQWRLATYTDGFFEFNINNHGAGANSAKDDAAADNNWHLITGVYSTAGGTNGTIYFYKDGVYKSSNTPNATPSRNGEVDIATRSAHTNNWQGWVDEASIASTIRDDGWIKLCYQNQQAVAIGGSGQLVSSLIAKTQPPTTQASGVTFSSVAATTMTVSWTIGNGASRAVFMKAASSGSAAPAYGTTYTAGTAYGNGTADPNGWYCVYNGTGTTVNVTGLAPYTMYRAMVCEYNGSGTTAGYNTNTAANNPNNQTTVLAAPTTQASGVTFSSVAATTMTISWTNGNGGNRTVFVYATGSGSAAPADGAAYTANTAYGSGTMEPNGWYCVYNGTGTSVTITGLTANTQYRAMVCEYNGSGASSLYNRSTATGNPNNQTTPVAAPTTQASGVNFTSITSTGMTINWTNGNGAGRAAFVYATSGGTAAPVGGGTYTANTTYGGGSTEPNGWYCVYNGTGTSIAVTGMTQGTTYRAMVCEYNGSGAGASYNTNAASNNPNNQGTVSVTQATTVAFGSVTAGGMTIGWTRGSGDYCAVFVYQGSSGSAAPVNGTGYTAGAVFKGGDQIGSSGWYCIYNGTGTSITVTGMAAGTAYRAMACEYVGSGSSASYNTNTAASNPNNQTTSAAGSTDNYGLWAYSANIVLNTVGAGVNTEQDDFPVLIRLTNSIFLFAQAQSNGGDIRFSTSGGTHLPYQRERWNTSLGLAEIWVKTNVLGGNSTQYIIMYWGNPGAGDSSSGSGVFSTANNFAAVYHLNDAIANGGTFTDATGTYNATGNSYVTTHVSSGTSLIGPGQTWDGGTTNPVALTMSTGVVTPATGTISYWCKLPASLTKATGTNNPARSAFGTESGSRFYLGYSVNSTTQGQFDCWVGANNYNPTTYVSPSTIYYFTVTWAGGTEYGYLNGSLLGSAASAAGGTPAVCEIGGSGNPIGDREWQGELDEVRIDKTNRTADWINLCYQNQNPGGDALTTMLPPTPTLSSPSNGATGISTSQTLAWNASFGATSYQLQVSTVSNFATTVYNGSGLTSTSQVPTGLTSNTTYYWHVDATNARGTSPYSPTWSFATSSVVSTRWSVAGLGTISGGAGNESAIYIGTAAPSTLYSRSLSNGSQNWAFPSNHGACQKPTHAYTGTSYKVFAASTDYVIALQDNGSGYATISGWPGQEISCTGAGTPYVSVNNSYLYVPCTDGNLRQINISNGAVYKTQAVSGLNVSADMIAAGDYVYVATNDGHISRHDAGDVTTVSSYSIGSATGINLPLLRSGTTLYVTPNNQTLMAFTVPAVSTKWTPTALTYSQSGNNTGAAYASGDRDTIYTAAGAYVYKIGDAGASASEKWYFQAPATVNSGPICYGSTVYFGCSNGSYYAINDANRSVRTNWPGSTGSSDASGGPWIDLSNNQVIFGTAGGHLDAYTLEP